MKIVKPKDLLKIKGPWFHKQFHAYPMTLGSTCTGALLYSKKLLPYSLECGVCFYTNSIADWYWNKNEQLYIREKIIKRQINNPAFAVNINKGRHKEFVKFKKQAEIFYGLDLKKMTNKQLFSVYKKFLTPFYRQWGWGVFSEPFLGTGDDWFSDELRSDAMAKFGASWADVLPIIGLPDQPSFVNREHNSILDIAISLHQKRNFQRIYRHSGPRAAFALARHDNKIWKLLIKHTKDFFWVEDNYSIWRQYDEYHFFKKALSLAGNNPLELKRVEQQRLKLQMNKKKDFLKKLSVRSRRLVLLENILSESTDERKSTSFRSAKVWFTLADEIARRSGLKESVILHMVDKEIEDYLLRGKIDGLILRGRQKRCLLIHLHRGTLVFSGEELDGVKPTDFEDDDLFSGVIKGVVACPGVVIGKVRVVIKHNEIGEVKKGEILVTNNTTPDYVPAMRKAAAIITEQGGITSHAALVSRELGVPCVIGTKIATRVLKTGDRVEVDANKGIIRKL